MANTHPRLAADIQRNRAVDPAVNNLLNYLVTKCIPNVGRLTANADVASSTTLAAVSDLTLSQGVGIRGGQACIGGRTYKLRVFLPLGTVDGTNGIKIDLNGGTATFSSIALVHKTYTASAIAAANVTNLTTGVNGTTSWVQVEYEGTLVCSGSGSIAVRLAQNTSGATVARIAAGAYIELTEIAQ